WSMSDQRPFRRFSRREILNGLAALVPLSAMTGLVAACGQPAAPAAPTASSAAAPKTPSTEPVTLTFMSWSATPSPPRQTHMHLADEYMKVYPNVTIKTDDVPFN